MFWIFLTAVALGFVLFKLGAYSVMLGLSALLGKVALFATGLFLLTYYGRRAMSRRRTVTVDLQR